MVGRDRELGMHRDITRRDFLNGVSIAAGASFLPWQQALADFSVQMQPGYYPPTRDGLRGSHPGSFEVAHEIRDGAGYDPGDADDTGEDYDLVVVGGGISGLASAHFYRKEFGANARILILDNHDDFGGHAKRNEFEIDGRTLVDLGGTEYIEAPWSYPGPAKTLLDDLGIDVEQAKKVFDHELYPSLDLRGGVFFDRDTFGEDRLVAGAPGVSRSEHQSAYVTLPSEIENKVGDEKQVRALFERAPLSPAAIEELVDLYCSGRDYLPGKSRKEKQHILMSMSYLDFLRDVVGAGTEVIEFFRMMQASYMGNGNDLTPALAAMRYGQPGATGMDLGASAERSAEWKKHSYREDFHFPDGNASIARMLVRHLIPAVAPGSTMHDIITARFDYSELDRDDSPVRIRLNSTAVHVQHRGDMDAAKYVDVTYVQGDKAYRVRSRHCILACYHAVIPHLCPELSQRQKEALRGTIRMPLISTNVLVRNWKAFEKLGIFAAYCPGSWFSDIRLTYPLRFGDYASPRSPDEPITVHLYRTPLPAQGTSALEQFRAGRYEILGTSFADYERRIRDQLGAMLGEGGFDPADDIRAITVNRWPHGYAVGYDYEKDRMAYYQPEWPDEKKLWLTGRQRIGRIAIANSDAAARAMTEAAIGEGYRATRELLETS